MSFAPGSYQLCVVNSAVVADDEELSALSAVVLDQTMQEAYEGITAHGASLECESRQSLIVHGRDHDGGAVAGTAVMQDRRRLSARCVAANSICVLLDRSFIFPKNGGLFLFGTLSNSRVVRFKPAPDRNIILLNRFLFRTLRGHSP